MKEIDPPRPGNDTTEFHQQMFVTRDGDLVPEKTPLQESIKDTLNIK